MFHKQILTEVILPERKPLIMESATDGKFLYLKGLFLEGETPNHNGRNYPRLEIEKAVNELRNRIAERGPIPGELDHPEGLNINFDRISHLITEIHMDGNNGVGTMKVINEGCGRIVRGCAEAGMLIGVSSRGSGAVDGMGKVSEYDIVTIDIVANPSAPHAFQKASLAESIMKSKNGREALYLSEVIKNDAAAQKYLQTSIQKFIEEIQNDYVFRG